MFCLLRTVLLKCHGVSIKYKVIFKDRRDPCAVNLQKKFQGQILLKPHSLKDKRIRKIRTAQQNVYFERFYLWPVFFFLFFFFVCKETTTP